MVSSVGPSVALLLAALAGGAAASAVHFGAAGISVGPDAALALRRPFDLSLEAWLEPPSALATRATPLELVAGSADGDDLASLCAYWDDGRLHLYSVFFAARGEASVEAPPSPIHVSVVWTLVVADQWMPMFYVNSIPIEPDQPSTELLVTIPDDAGVGLNCSAWTWVVGRWPGASGIPADDGALDEVRIWEGAADAEFILVRMTSPSIFDDSTAPYLWGSFSFQEGAGLESVAFFPVQSIGETVAALPSAALWAPSILPLSVGGLISNKMDDAFWRTEPLPDPAEFPWGQAPYDTVFSGGNVIAISPSEVFLFGGCQTVLPFLALPHSTWILTLPTNSWRLVADEDASPPHSCRSAMAVRHRVVYMFGGVSLFADQFSTANSQLWTFDLDSLVWSRKADMPVGSMGAEAMLVDGRIALFGGLLAVPVPLSPNITWYDPATDSYETTPTTGTVPTSLGMTYVRVGHSSVLAMGGFEDLEDYVAEQRVMILDLETRVWTVEHRYTILEQPLARSRGILRNGYVYLVGGQSAVGTPTFWETRRVASVNRFTRAWTEHDDGLLEEAPAADVMATAQIGSDVILLFQPGLNPSLQEMLDTPFVHGRFSIDRTCTCMPAEGFCSSGICVRHSSALDDATDGSDGPSDAAAESTIPADSSLLVILLSIACGLVVLAVSVFALRQRAKTRRRIRETSMVKLTKLQLGVDLELGGLLGTGPHSSVYSGHWRGAAVAVRMIETKDPWTDEQHAQFEATLARIAPTRHPNLILIMGIVVDPPGIVEELMGMGSLRDCLVTQRHVLTLSRVWRIATDVARGLAFLHECGIVHGALKSTNVLLDERINVKISDVGFHRDLAGSPSLGGAVAWTSPEVIMGADPTPPSDVYSFAIVLWELLTRRIPYQFMHQAGIVHCVVADNLRPTLPPFLSDQNVSLLASLWATDATMRPTSDALFDMIHSQGQFGTNAFVVETLQRTLHGPPSILMVKPRSLYDIWDESPEQADDICAEVCDALEAMGRQHNAIMTSSGGEHFAFAVSSVGEAVDLSRTICARMPDGATPRQQESAHVMSHAAVGLDSVDPIEWESAKRNPDAAGDLVRRVSEEALQLATSARPGHLLMTIGAVGQLPAEFVPQPVRARQQTGNGGVVMRIELGSNKSPSSSAQHTERSFPGRVRHPAENIEVELLSQHGMASSLGDVTEETLVTAQSSPRNTAPPILAEGSVVVSDKIVGKGTTGEVLLGEWKGRTVCVKRLMMHKVNEANKRYILREASMLAVLRHQNVVEFYGVILGDPSPSLVMEYLSEGTLWSALRQGGRWIEARRRQLCLGIASGMQYLHRNSVMHRDLKSQNLLLTGEMVPKLTDFGFARIKSDYSTMSRVGSIAWTAPEVLRGQRYSEMADVYSYGIVVWEIVTRRIPYQDESVGDDFLGLSARIFAGTRPALMLSEQREWSDLVKIIYQCWASDPEARPGFDAVVDALMVDQAIEDGT